MQFLHQSKGHICNEKQKIVYQIILWPRSRIPDNKLETSGAEWQKNRLRFGCQQMKRWADSYSWEYVICVVQDKNCLVLDCRSLMLSTSILPTFFQLYVCSHSTRSWHFAQTLPVETPTNRPNQHVQPTGPTKNQLFSTNDEMTLLVVNCFDPLLKQYYTENNIGCSRGNASRNHFLVTGCIPVSKIFSVLTLHWLNIVCFCL